MILLNSKNKKYKINNYLDDIDSEKALKYLTSYTIQCEITNIQLISIVLSDEPVKLRFYNLLSSSVLFRLSNITIKCLFKYLIYNNINEFYTVFDIIANNKFMYIDLLKNMINELMLEIKENKYKEIINNAIVLRCLTT